MEIEECKLRGGEGRGGEERKGVHVEHKLTRGGVHASRAVRRLAHPQLAKPKTNTIVKNYKNIDDEYKYE
jgi:hypothetical protein